MAPPPVEEHQAPRTSIQSKTKKFFSPSGLESFFKKSSLKVGLANFKEPVAGDAFDRIKVHGERKSVSSTAEGAGDVAVTLKRNFTGRSKLDYLLNTIIEHILRDFIHSWFSAVSADKEFVDVRSKHSIEETIGDVCLRCVASKSPPGHRYSLFLLGFRIKSISWQPLFTTTIVDHLATHTRLYRLAQQAVKQPNPSSVQSSRLSPFRKINPNDPSRRQHRRNKSDTDLNWHLGEFD